MIEMQIIMLEVVYVKAITFKIKGKKLQLKSEKKREEKQ